MYLNCVMPYKIPVFRGKAYAEAASFQNVQTGVVKTSKLSGNSAAAGS